MTKLKLVSIVAVLTMSSLVGLGTFSLVGGFGTRGEKIIYEFQYLGKPAQVIQIDRKYSPDKYYALLANGDKTRANLTTDTGEKISFYDSGAGCSINGEELK